MVDKIERYTVNVPLSMLKNILNTFQREYDFESGLQDGK